MNIATGTTTSTISMNTTPANYRKWNTRIFMSIPRKPMNIPTCRIFITGMSIQGNLQRWLCPPAGHFTFYAFHLINRLFLCLPASDLLHLPCTPDLTEAGIAYACRSLAYARQHMGG